MLPHAKPGHAVSFLSRSRGPTKNSSDGRDHCVRLHGLLEECNRSARPCLLLPTSGSRTVTTITGMADSSRFPFSHSRTPTPSPRHTKIPQHDMRLVRSGLTHGLDAIHLK
jgi:hypothetical protein